MKNLEKNFKVENFDIKADHKTKQNYTKLLSKRKLLDIRTKNNLFNIRTESIKTICSLCNEDIEEWVLFLYEIITPKSSSSNSLLTIEDKITTDDNVVNLPVEIITSDTKKQSKYENKYHCILSIIYFIIGSLLLFHILSFILSEHFCFCLYMISTVVLSQVFFDLGFLYCKSLGESKRREVKIVHITCSVYTIVNFIILNIKFFSGQNMKNYYDDRTIQIVIMYLTAIVVCIAGWIVLHRKRNDKYSELKVEMTEVSTH